ncbi:MAG: 16S rRNA processing protein RimM [Chitinophagales bacterium]|nr:16S rRNA processing protein RimM [Chitinophagales bacterium]
MAIDQYIYVGKIGKTHALAGALNVYWEVEVLNTSFKVIYLKEKENHIPYFIDHLETLGDHSYIVFEDHKSKELAHPLVNKELYIKEKDFSKYFEEIDEDFEFIIGFHAYQDKEFIGNILEIHHNSAHQLALIKHHEKEIYIPLVDEFIVSIDDEKEKIVFDLPIGLLDL